jgi:hypothetical protein
VFEKGSGLKNLYAMPAIILIAKHNAALGL